MAVVIPGIGDWIRYKGDPMSMNDFSGPDDVRARFHLALPVRDLDAAARFYGDVLGCTRGRQAAHWIDWNLGGHQVVTHVVDGWTGVSGSNPVDGSDVPVPHFGLLLRPDAWQALADRLVANDVEFVIEPTVRFRGEVGEQRTMFFLDPSGNALEFKSFADDDQVFAT